MVRTQIQLTEEQAKALKRLSLSRRSSVAELIRAAVNDLIRKDPFPDRAQVTRRAIAVAGRFASGRKDVSSKHDEHLAEVFRK